MVLYLSMWLLGSPDDDIVSVHRAPVVQCGFIGDDESFYEAAFLYFQLHLLVKFTPFHFVCWFKGLHQSHLVQFKT
jgi:hypothetical protein